MKKIELLAPAGSLETLKAVCAAGADAVYLGGGQFGARAYAKNFTEDELLYAIDYVHLHGKKLHLTVNTLLKNRELEEQLYDYLLPYYEQGLDAAIVQDAGVFSFLKKHFPGMELHASTQMTVAGAEGARFWADAGADRIVLARELSIDEIRRIHESLDVELECFVHGALCYCYSGQCLFSSMLGGRSGNRGRCAQPCRLPYGVADEKHMLTKGELYPLSPKDLCGIDLLPELIAAGVSSLKIEGRMKQTQYAAGVTKIYRKYLDLLESEDIQAKDCGRKKQETRKWNGKNDVVAESDRKALLDLGNRSGFTAGYLRGEKGREMMSLRSPKHTSLQGEGESANTAEAPKLPVTGLCVCRQGQPIRFDVTDQVGTHTATVYGGEVQPAKNAPAQPSDIEKVLCQTGDTDFQFTSVQVELDENCFIPKQFFKAVRREALEQLKEQMLLAHRRYGQALLQDAALQEEILQEGFSQNTSLQYTKHTGQHAAPLRTRQLLVVCDTAQQLDACLKKDYIGTVALQLQGVLPEQLSRAAEAAAGQCQSAKKKLLLALPSVFRAETADFYEKHWNCIKNLHRSGKVDGFLAKNYDSLGFLRRMGVPEEDVWLDSQIYTFSARSISFFREQGYQNRTLPLELNAKELRRLPQDGSVLIIYGHAPFMVSSQCVNKNISGCDRTGKTLTLVDRYGKHLPVKNYCSVCCNVVYNSVPTLLFSGRTWLEVENVHPQTLRMDFTVENALETGAVLALYEQQILGRPAVEAPFAGETTRGHFGRGVE